MRRKSLHHFQNQTLSLQRVCRNRFPSFSLKRVLQMSTVPIRECFLPFYAFEITNLRSEFSAVCHVLVESFEKYSDSCDLMKPTSTHLKIVEGVLPSKKYDLESSSLQIFASFDFPKSVVESSLFCKELVFSKQLQPEQLLDCEGKKREVLAHSLSLPLAMEQMVRKLKRNFFFLVSHLNKRTPGCTSWR